MRERALRFATRDDLVKALHLLDKLAAQGPLEYDLAGGNTAVLPEWSYDRLAPLLKQHQVCYEELEVVPMSALPPEEQAQRRGLVWQRD